MFTATAQAPMLPATVTGSWPRPRWYRAQAGPMQLTTRLLDSEFREQFLDASAVVVADQKRAGLDILTNGDMHLDDSLAGYGWMDYILSRLRGTNLDHRILTSALPQPPGTMLAEVLGAWRFPPVTGEIGIRVPFDLDVAWRAAQDHTTRPVKIGIADGPALGYALASCLQTERYSRDGRELMRDLAVAVNGELRQLARAGCTVIQVEDPMIHLLRAVDPTADIACLVDLLNQETDGLGDSAEVWVHTCFGSPAAQSFFTESTYAHSLEAYLYRVNCDVLTLELCDRGLRDVELLGRYRDARPKIAAGVVSHRTLQSDLPEDVAARIETVLKYVPPERLVLSSDCGFGRHGAGRLTAFYKAKATATAAGMVRAKLGVPVTEPGSDHAAAAAPVHPAPWAGTERAPAPAADPAPATPAQRSPGKAPGARGRHTARPSKAT